MKKTININLGGTNFVIDEDAYARLEQYLSSVKSHFNSYPENEEIVADIESRIAEQFSSEKVAIISLDKVEKLIVIMGDVKQFGDVEVEGGKTHSDTSEKAYPKRLFRDVENGYVGGVAAGLAAYFNVDIIITRLFFALLLFAGGSGFLIYFVLWVVIPEAKTPIEKMQMRGEPVKLEELGKKLKEEAENMKHSRAYRDFGSATGKVFNGIAAVIRKIFSVVGKISGVGIAVFSVMSIMGLSFLFVVCLFNVNNPYVDFPLAQIANSPWYYVILTTLYLVILIPFIFVWSLSSALMRGKGFLNSKAIAALIGLWFIAGSAGGTLALRYGPEWYERYKSLPEQQVVTKAYPDVRGFKSVDISEASIANVKYGLDYAVNVSGTQKEVATTNLVVKDGILTLERVYDKNEKFCLFCDIHRGVTLDITMPLVEYVEVSGASRLNLEGFKLNTLTSKLSGSSRMNFDSEAREVNLTLSGASRGYFRGKTQSLILGVSGASRFEGFDLVTDTADVKASGASRVLVNVFRDLKTSASGSSRVIYKGDPSITDNMSGGSVIRSYQEDLDVNSYEYYDESY